MRITILGSWMLAALVLAPPEFHGAQRAAFVLVDDDENDYRNRGYYGQRPDDGYSGRDGYYSRGRGGGYSPASRAIRDLESIASRSRVDRHEHKHFSRAIQELYTFEDRLRRGRFDKGRLDRAIGNINHLAQADQIHPRDRARLRGHLYELRRFRSRR
jgi:hypothetical protein